MCDGQHESVEEINDLHRLFSPLVAKVNLFFHLSAGFKLHSVNLSSKENGEELILRNLSDVGRLLPYALLRSKG